MLAAFRVGAALPARVDAHSMNLVALEEILEVPTASGEEVELFAPNPASTIIGDHASVVYEAALSFGAARHGQAIELCHVE